LVRTSRRIFDACARSDEDVAAIVFFGAAFFGAIANPSNFLFDAAFFIGHPFSVGRNQANLTYISHVSAPLEGESREWPPKTEHSCSTCILARKDANALFPTLNNLLKTLGSARFGLDLLPQTMRLEPVFERFDADVVDLAVVLDGVALERLVIIRMDVGGTP
jgi:hypothetical protein